jgi:hypothetical protein
MVNGSQHVALNITISAADAYMQTALKSLEKSINNHTFMQRLNDEGVSSAILGLHIVIVLEKDCIVFVSSVFMQVDC